MQSLILLMPMFVMIMFIHAISVVGGQCKLDFVGGYLYPSAVGGFHDYLHGLSVQWSN